MSTDRPSGGDHRPDQAPETDRDERRPFPGQPENRPLAPPPTGYRSFDEIRAERAAQAARTENSPAPEVTPRPPVQPGRDTTSRLETTAPDPETSPRQPPVRDTARDSRTPGQPDDPRQTPPPVPPETRTSATGDGPPPGEPARSARSEHTPNDGTGGQNSGGNDKGGDRSGSGGDGGSSPGGDRSGGDRGGGDRGSGGSDGPGSDPPDGPGPKGPKGPDGPNGPKGPDDGDGPAGGEAKPKQLFLHAHSAFKDTEDHYYSRDGKDWWSGEAQAAKERQAAAEEQGTGTAPRQRDLGENTVGENPDVHLGDTTDMRTFGEKMAGEPIFQPSSKEKTDDPSESKVGRSFDVFFEEADDTHDGIGGVGQSLSAIIDRGPAPTGAYTVQSARPGYEATPTHGVNTVDAVGAIVVTIAAAVTGLRRLPILRRREHERDHPRR